MSDADSNQGSQQQEEEEKVTLTQEQITAGLSQIRRTSNGSSFAYSILTLEELENEKEFLLGDDIKNHVHLQQINIKSNNLKDASVLAQLPHLLHINVPSNQIASMDFFSENEKSLQYLQQVDMSQNKIKALKPLPQERLERFNLNENAITTAEEFTGHKNIKIFNLEKNQLTSCLGLHNMLALTELYLAENQITSMEGLMDMPLLKKLDLRGNKIEKIEHVPDLPQLESLNLDENQIADCKQIASLEPMTSVTILSLKGNPCAEEKGDDFKKEVLMQLIEMKQLKTVNEEELTPQDWTDAANDLAERKQQELDDAANKKDGDGDGDGDGDD